MAELHQDERRLLVLIEMTEGLRVTGSPLTPRVITIAGVTIDSTLACVNLRSLGLVKWGPEASASAPIGLTNAGTAKLSEMRAEQPFTGLGCQARIPDGAGSTECLGRLVPVDNRFYQCTSPERHRHVALSAGGKMQLRRAHRGE